MDRTSPLPYALAAAAVVLMLGLLTTQLLVLHSQYTTARKQLVLQAELVRPSKPVLREAEPLLRSARYGQLHATVEDLRAFLETAKPLLRDAPPALRATRRVADQTLETDLVPRLARATGRVDNLLRRSRQTVAIGRDSLAIQRQALTILQQSLDIQRQTLAHAESIDRKTGGTAAPAPVAAPAAP